MQSPSISGFMALILLLAVNLASARLLAPSASGRQEWEAISMGLMPLLNVVLIGLWALVPRYDFAVEKRPPSDRGRLFPPFVAASAVLLVTLAVANWVSWPHLWDYIEFAARVIGRVVPGIKQLDESVLLHRFALIPAILGILISGPPLLLALAWGFVARHFRLVITPRG